MNAHLLRALLGAVLLLSACSPAPGATPTPTGAPATKPTAAAAAQPPAPTGAPVEIRFGHGSSAEEPFWALASLPKQFPNQGKLYTLSLTAFRGGADRLSAYEAGQIDAGTVTPAAGLFASEQGVPLKLIAGLSRESVDPQYFRTTFLALQDAGIQSNKDLKGKTIGINDFRSASEMWARAAVQAAGLDPDKDVKYVVIPFPGMGDALRSKQIDVGSFPQPFYAQEVQKGGVVDVFTSKTGVPIDEDLIMVMMRPEFLANNREAVRGFLADLQAATQFYLEHAREARQAILDSKLIRVDPSLYLDMHDYYHDPKARIAVDGLKRVQDLQLQLGWQAKGVDIDQLVDQSLLPT
jgi:ABC-type nitrate/sulfonate/bicarbonate transport system substrate-binding protein